MSERPQTSDAQIEALMNDIQDDYEAANANWKPPVVDSICVLLVDVQKAIFKTQEGQQVLSITPVFSITDGQHTGRLFRERWNNENPQRFQTMRRGIDSLLHSEEYGLEASGNLAEDVAALEALCGRLYVSGAIRQSKKSDFRYFAIKKVEAVSEAPAETAAA